MPILTHKVTGQVTNASAETVAKLRSQGKIDAYRVEEDTPPKTPKEVKEMSSTKKTDESVKHGTSTIIDGASSGDARTSE